MYIFYMSHDPTLALFMYGDIYLCVSPMFAHYHTHIMVC